jgi:hypothetical protein
MDWPREIKEWLEKRKAAEEIVEYHKKNLEGVWAEFRKKLQQFAEEHASALWQAYHDLMATTDGQKLLKDLFDAANDVKKDREREDEASKGIDDATKKNVLEAEKSGASDAAKAAIIKAWREYALKKAAEESDKSWAEFKKIIDWMVARDESDEVMDEIRKAILELEHAKAEAEKHKSK